MLNVRENLRLIRNRNDGFRGFFAQLAIYWSTMRFLGSLLAPELIVFLGIQFIRPALDNPPVTAEIQAPHEDGLILRNSGYRVPAVDLPWLAKKMRQRPISGMMVPDFSGQSCTMPRPQRQDAMPFWQSAPRSCRSVLDTLAQLFPHAVFPIDRGFGTPRWTPEHVGWLTGTSGGGLTGRFHVAYFAFPCFAYGSHSTRRICSFSGFCGYRYRASR